MKKYLIPLFFIAISQLAGIIGSVFTVEAIPTWYAELNKPSFNPPGWIFGPVWFILFTMMGIAAYLVWTKREKNRTARVALVLFYLHLFFNTAWSIIFFGMQDPTLAFIDILVLLSMIVTIIVLYVDVSKVAAYLMLPYLLWVSFASMLNYYIIILN